MRSGFSLPVVVLSSSWIPCNESGWSNTKCHKCGEAFKAFDAARNFQSSLSCLFDFAISCLAVKRGGCEQMCSNSVVPCTTCQGTYDIVYGLRPAPPTHV